MSVRRLLLTAAAMALAGGALAGLTPAIPEMAGAVRAGQRTADTAGPDALVAAVAGLLAWLVWAWGALGLALTAASAAPGVLGGAARLATRLVLPAGARRGAAVLLGIGLGVTGPLVSGATLHLLPAVAAVPVAGVPDWPSAPSSTSADVPRGVPDWPEDLTRSVPEGGHVVVRGDCLWHIAAERIRARTGAAPADAAIARAVHAWWSANADVIGPDPDRLVPGQVLRPPDAP